MLLNTCGGTLRGVCGIVEGKSYIERRTERVVEPRPPPRAMMQPDNHCKLSDMVLVPSRGHPKERQIWCSDICLRDPQYALCVTIG